jgi:hypothetical protein
VGRNRAVDRVTFDEGIMMEMILWDGCKILVNVQADMVLHSFKSFVKDHRELVICSDKMSEIDKWMTIISV